MVQLFRAENSEGIPRSGYSARYIADVKFRTKIESGGFILVTIPTGTSSTPHSHVELEEVFVALSEVELHVNDTILHLSLGDTVIVEPGENHSFRGIGHSDSIILAIKFPNIKDDKIVPSS
ncbi:MAG: cupin domain-containing protein [Candidatus Thorarchaeota archaeon]|nr:cupin domain-containing protein [Candidatus Thorarchaeota archaeon]